MKRLSDFIVKKKFLVLIIGLILIVPALIGFISTKINYDILVYLPDEVETIKGEKILTDKFKLGSYAFVMINDKAPKDVLKVEKKIKRIKGVNRVISGDDLTGGVIPKSMIPNNLNKMLYNKNSTLVIVTFDKGASEDTTINAIRELRKIEHPDLISSMTCLVVDTMDISNSEIIIYILIAVVLCFITLTFTTESYFVPPLLLLNIGIAILYNFGTNIFLGQISYITKAIAAILQLGVTTDFSIFLYHKYESLKKKYSDNDEAMSEAIVSTSKSLIGSSLTTIAGFLALIFMTLTLGKDIGLVMAKGVLFGLLSVLTIFPALLLVFDKIIDKTTHKSYFPSFNKVKSFILNKRKLIVVLFLLLLIPAYIGNSNYKVYYKLDESLPNNLAFKTANKKLEKDFNIISPCIILIDKNLSQNKVKDLSNDLKNTDGIDLVLSPNEVVTTGIKDILPKELDILLNNDKYNLIIINSKYEVASNKLNSQVIKIDKLVKSYDKNSIVAGEGALMKDLVKIADHDFKAVSYASILVILVIMFFVLTSLSLPIILVIIIEFAIFLNMACAYYMGTTLPFIASIIVGTIQLGATIDYAILMSTRYIEERKKEKNKNKALKNTLDGVFTSIITSALCLFSATIGVGIFTKIDIIGSICVLLARGAIISMLTVLIILPNMLVIFDKFFIKKEGLK